MPLFICELANNHNGDLQVGKKIIDEFHKVTKQFPNIDFAFKFQRRNLKSLIHKDHIKDTGSIERFKKTQMSYSRFNELVQYAKSKDYKTICTPFDEQSVDELMKVGLDYIKVASCSILDWPLLNKIVSTELPIIASIGGIHREDLDKVVSFFQHRRCDFSLLYCVGLYPTTNTDMCLKKLDDLAQYGVPFGLSSHEINQNTLSIPMAIAKGASIFERHVVCDLKTANSYSITPRTLKAILTDITKAVEINTIKDNIIQQTEKLDTFKRFAFLKQNVASNEYINDEMLYFAIPKVDINHISVFECTKYKLFKATTAINKDAPLLKTEVTTYNNEGIILRLHEIVIDLLNQNGLGYILNTNPQLEISHHYGIGQFEQYGMFIITLINREYCKKLLLLKVGQNNPEHYHNTKTETFTVVKGSPLIVIDGVKQTKYNVGDMVTVLPKQKHYIAAPDCDCIIEELSTNHSKNDSFYTDENIQYNLNRKTLIYL